MSSGADAEASHTVVSANSWAKSGDVVAAIISVTPASSGPEGQASTAIIISGTTAGNASALVSARTPRESGVTDTISTSVVIVGALGGDVSALVCGGAPGSSKPEGHAASASIASCAAARNINAGSLG